MCGHELLDQLEVRRGLHEAAAIRVALLREADVVRDLVEPRRLELGRRAAPEPTEGVHERDLRCVLGLLTVAELVLAEAQDLALVALVEQARGLVFRLVEPEGPGCRMAFVRYCGHGLSPT